MKTMLVLLITCGFVFGAWSQVLAGDRQSVQSGNWNDPATWGGELPTADDVAIILSDHHLFVEDEAVAYDAHVMGKLTIQNGGLLRVRTLKVMRHGECLMNVDAHIVIRDLPYTDDGQVETGIMNMGTFRAEGIEKTTWTRATQALVAGDQQVQVQSVEGWQVGDQLVIGNTAYKGHIRGKTAQQEQYGQSDFVTITSIDENVVTFEPALSHDAPGIADNPWDVSAFTAIGNVSKSCTIRSENPDGVRGHIMSMDVADWMTSHTGIYDMGRTRADEILNPTTNHIGRYSLHFHRVRARGSEVLVDNCVISGFLKWGLVLHELSNSTITNNLVCDGDGGGIIAERGNEVSNLIENNLCVKIRGGYQFKDSRAGIRVLPVEWRDQPDVIDVDGRADFAADGSAIWTRSCGNDIVNNVAIDCAGYGVNINGYYRDSAVRTPDPGRVDGNEAAGCLGGIWAVWSQHTSWKYLQYNEEFRFSNGLLWNIQKDGIASYHDAFNHFVDITFINDPSGQQSNVGSRNSPNGNATVFFHSRRNYETIDFVMEGIRCYGANVGIELANPEQRSGSSHLRITDSEIHCFVGMIAEKPSYLQNVEVDDTVFRIEQQWQPDQSPFEEGLESFVRYPDVVTEEQVDTNDSQSR